MSKIINQIGMPSCGLSETKGRIRLFLHEIQTTAATVDGILIIYCPYIIMANCK